jgi:hypothetical protein
MSAGCRAQDPVRAYVRDVEQMLVKSLDLEQPTNAKCEGDHSPGKE